MPARARWYIGSRVTSRPSNMTVPPSESIRPMVMRKLVVLPAPLGPSRPTTSPWSTSKSTPLTTWRRPYHFSNPRTSRSGMARSSLIAAGAGCNSGPGVLTRSRRPQPRQASANPLHPFDVRPERHPGVAVPAGCPARTARRAASRRRTPFPSAGCGGPPTTSGSRGPRHGRSSPSPGCPCSAGCCRPAS